MLGRAGVNVLRRAFFGSHDRSRRLRKRQFFRAIDQGRFELLPDMVDPASEDRSYTLGRRGLFVAIDRLIGEKRYDDLPRLAPLVEMYPPLDRLVFPQLTAFYSGSEQQAIDALSDLIDQGRRAPHMIKAFRGWRAFLSSRRATFDSVPDRGVGPLIQYWDRRDPPPDVARSLKRWASIVGAGRHRAFHDASARDFLLHEFGRREASLYDRCGHPAIKSDYFRLGALLRLGGFYLDADARPARGFADRLEALFSADMLWMSTDSPTIGALNGFLSASVGSPLMASAFEEASRRLHDGGETGVMAIAGPHMLGDVFIELFDRGDLPLIKSLTNHERNRDIVVFDKTHPTRQRSHWTVHEEELRSRDGAEPPANMTSNRRTLGEEPARLSHS